MREVVKGYATGALFGFALLASPASALAADPALAGPAPVEPYQPAGSVSGSFTIYGWAPFVTGDAGVNGFGPVEVSLDPTDILDVLDFTVMASGEIRFDRFGLLGDLVYLKISDGAATPGPLFSSATVSLEALISTAAATYRIWDDGRSWVQGIAGIRYWSFDTTLSLSPGLLPGVSASDSISWVDPLVGIRAGYEVSERVFLTGSAAVGGFGAGSEFMWDLTGAVGYRFNRAVSVSAGYRALGVDYEKNGDVIDLVNHGPIFGLRVDF